MKRVQNITDGTHQRHTIAFVESEIQLVLRFAPTVGMWTADIAYRDVVIYGVALSLGVLHIRSHNLPFDFIVTDLSTTGLDPFRRDDFSGDRCALYLLEADDMEELRGAPVPL